MGNPIKWAVGGGGEERGGTSQKQARFHICLHT